MSALEISTPEISTPNPMIISELSGLVAFAEADYYKAKDMVFKTEYELVCAKRDVKIAEMKNDKAQLIFTSEEKKVFYLKKKLDSLIKDKKSLVLSEVCFLRNKLDIRLHEIIELHKKAQDLYKKSSIAYKSQYQKSYISDELFITMRNLSSKSRCDLNCKDLEEFKPEKSLAIIILQELLTETELKITEEYKDIYRNFYKPIDNDSDDDF